MLQVSRLTKRFGEAVALDGLSFSVGEGELVALVGPNGSGKTTTFRSILGLLGFQGEITVSDLEVRRRGREVRRLVGYLPQAPAFHDDLTARETLVYYARLRGLDGAHIERAGGVAGLDGFAHRRTGGLSSGMRQRLALAVALLGDPPLLLLDEPISSLDADSRRRFSDLLVEMKRQGRTVLVAAHSLSRLEPVLTGVVVLADGRAVYRGPVAAMPKGVVEEDRAFGSGAENVALLGMEATA